MIKIVPNVCPFSMCPKSAPIFCIFVGCLFHFSQCLWRNIQSSGLQENYNSSPVFQQMVRLFIALAFLPLELVEPTAKQMIKNLPSALAGFGSYFERQWLVNIGRFSITAWRCSCWTTSFILRYDRTYGLIDLNISSMRNMRFRSQFSLEERPIL